MDYSTLNDYELLYYCQLQDEEAFEILYKKYEPFLRKLALKISKACPNIGLDYHDFLQEERIALMVAAFSFHDEKETTFFSFASTCIKRHLSTFIRQNSSLKHQFLNEAFTAKENINYWLDKISDNTTPENQLIETEKTEEIFSFLKKNLSDLEEQVFLLKLSGLEYEEIATLLGKSFKSVDNSVQRIKGKIKEFLEQKQEE